MRVILPVSAASGVDTIIRAAANALSQKLGQPVVIENMPGAGGITGTAAIAKAAPDGLTVGAVSNNHVINPLVYRSLPYDAIADVAPITVIGATPFVLVVNPAKVPAKNARELVAFLKSLTDPAARMSWWAISSLGRAASTARASSPETCRRKSAAR